MPGIRLQRLLARHGFGSRRSCEELVRQGRVTVNGQVAQLGATSGAGDEVRVDGQPLRPAGPPRYLMLHKPAGYLVTLRDHRGRPTILDLLPAAYRDQVFPVGRLDLDSEGLLLLTNDGELAERLLHPRYGIIRGYLVWVGGAIGIQVLDRLARGVEIEPGVIVRCTVTVLRVWRGGGLLRIEIREGRKREVRRLCGAAGLRVARLKRVAFGPVRLGELPPGEVRALSASELAALRHQDPGLAGGGRPNTT
ncbi:MAG: pseudouridine synthase [Bacillota bacterium]|nr:pseudouridine synthase [Bacillota bacterium]